MIIKAPCWEDSRGGFGYLLAGRPPGATTIQTLAFAEDSLERRDPDQLPDAGVLVYGDMLRRHYRTLHPEDEDAQLNVIAPIIHSSGAASYLANNFGDSRGIVLATGRGDGAEFLQDIVKRYGFVPRAGFSEDDWTMEAWDERGERVPAPTRDYSFLAAAEIVAREYFRIAAEARLPRREIPAVMHSLGFATY